jgi:hypothetical protein
VGKDEDAPLPTPTFTPTPTTPAGPSQEMVLNGGFESGRTIWQESSSGGYNLIYEGENPRSGSWSAWLGGYDDADDRLYQAIDVPSWARSARLSFYLYVRSDDLDWPLDFFHGELQTGSGATLQTFGEVDNTWRSSNWYLIRQEWQDFSSHAGAQRRLLFQATNDFMYDTDFYIDDVSFVAISGQLSGGKEASGSSSFEVVPGGDKTPPDERSPKQKRD